MLLLRLTLGRITATSSSSTVAVGDSNRRRNGLPNTPRPRKARPSPRISWRNLTRPRVEDFDLAAGGLGGGCALGLDERSGCLKETRFRLRGRGKEFDDEIDECAELRRHELAAFVDHLQSCLSPGVIREDRGQYVPEHRVVEQNRGDRCYADSSGNGVGHPAHRAVAEYHVVRNLPFFRPSR